MLREIAHFVRHAPAALHLKATARSQAELYDAVMARAVSAGIDDYRRALVRGLEGNVIEVGAGTGLMFPHYESGVKLTAIEPDASFRALAEPRGVASRAEVTLLSGTVEHLPFPDQHFDAVVVALVLCSVASMEDALGELSRVLRRGGEARFIEHVKSDKPVAGALMDLFDPIWLRLNGMGCHLNRDPEPLFETHGFDVYETQPFQVFTPGIPAFPMRLIRARRR